VLDHQAVHDLREVGAERDARSRRLEPEDAATEAGMRIDPPPSLACAIGTIPAATAAAEPPLDPPSNARRSRVLARAEQTRLGGRQNAELGRVRFPNVTSRLS